MTKEEYEAYLQSEAWAIRRQACMDRFGGQCALCENKAWHAHHRTYDRVGHEHPNDLTALCGSCHEKFHGKGKFEDVEVEVMLEAKQRREARKVSQKPKEEEPKRSMDDLFSILRPPSLFSRPPLPHNTTPTTDDTYDDAARPA